MGRFWSLLLLWSLLYWSLEQLQVETTKAIKSDTYERIIPERLDRNRRKRDLSTFNAEGHDNEATFLIKAFNKKMIVRAERNTIILAPTFKLRYYKKDNSKVLHEANPEQCYYHGTVHGKRDSVVVLNTCKGLSGLIDDGEVAYHIEPDKSDTKDGAHIIYHARDEHAHEELKFPYETKCGYTEEDGNYTKDENEREHLIHDHQRVRRDVDDVYKKYLTTSKTRYNELVVIVDHGMYLAYNNDTEFITNRVMSLTNALDAIYRRINIRIVLVGLDIWSNGDRMNRSRYAGTDLGSLKKYRFKHLKPEFPGHDNVQLISQWWWDKRGLAVGSAMCWYGSVAMQRWAPETLMGPFGTVAHEMGHNFGMPHDGTTETRTCECLTPRRGCVMGRQSSRVPGFSNCSLIGLSRINDKCLFNYPTKVERPECGNGILEEGEECDCGSVEMCKKDPCCKPNNCKLKAYAQCSALDKCCSNCVFKKQGTLCRARKTDCDVPEFCTGNSGVCPKDSYIKNGYPCNHTKAAYLLRGNEHSNRVVQQLLQPRIQARYVRIQPQFWREWICMKAELLGCAAGKDCVVPLGLQSGEIKDSQISASSRKKTKLPKYGRLHHSKSWCASRNNKDEYLQIDLGKSVTISGVQTQGRVTWYHLYYSDDGEHWTVYTRENILHSESFCYKGKCSETRDTQCKNIWGEASNSGVDGCYKKLNTESTGYGTCDPTSTVPCKLKHAFCGQLQCLATKPKPIDDYGLNYTTITLDSGDKCSAAKLKHEDAVGSGMVAFGTKCGDGKMCVDYKCKSLSEIGIKRCPVVNGKECSGRGVCLNTGECHCEGGYDPNGACKKPIVPHDGQWSKWSSWTLCDKGCNGGQKSRHRFCDNPFPANGGKDCNGDRFETQTCNTDACPVIHSCRHLQQIGIEKNHDYPDGIYNIYPEGHDKPIQAYCDMSRDGGGWTLLVTSHTNTWTADNVRLRNSRNPRLDGDYSILSYADVIKNNFNIKGSTFEYRLEAHSRGRWGGIWQAPREYTFTATNNNQTWVELVKKFDKWEYDDKGIEERMPWLYGGKLTTSSDATKRWWGSVTGDDTFYYPAPWIRGYRTERKPENIWYWMREGPYVIPQSCLEVQLRGYYLPPHLQLKNGAYTIKPPGHKEVRTYCDVTRNGGGWTLLVTSASKNGWTKDNIKIRNPKAPSLTSDFSILGVADSIKDFDKSQKFFEYRIEADGNNRWGGIWKAPKEFSFVATSQDQNRIKLIQQFDKWNLSTNLALRMPRINLSHYILLTSASGLDDLSGTIVSNKNSKHHTTYLQGSREFPKVVRYWMREGTRRSCNDIKLHGVRAGKTYEDDYYMISPVYPEQYLPVFCDMTSDAGAFTLLVTSANGNWTRAQVPLRNEMRPSLIKDYSILKYGDVIKGLSNGATFKYKLDAYHRNRWGGVFVAPAKYSFLATNNRQTNVTLVKKFDNWKFSWWKSLNRRMPWFDTTGKHRKALLTTSDSPTYYPSGSIIYGNMEWDPAYWMRGGSGWPGTIWYWANEDDCDLDRKPVNGGLTEWSSWSHCDKLCDSTAKQRRQRTCTNPKPRCGGEPCDTSVQALEERSCYYCPETPIKSAETGRCVQPATGGCNPAEGTHLIFYSKKEKCEDPYMAFTFDYDGILRHKCSGMIVCPQDGEAKWRKRMLLQKTCDMDVAKLRRLPSGTLQNVKTGFCVHPHARHANKNVPLIYWKGCNGKKLPLTFINL